MPILLISALLLAGFGYWEYIRLKAVAGAPQTPQQIAASDTPLLSKEVLDLYFNGRDPQAMHSAAARLEEYDFFDSAMLLHKRADQLSAVAPPVIPGIPAQSSQPTQVPPYGGMAPPVLPYNPSRETTQQGPAVVPAPSQPVTLRRRGIVTTTSTPLPVYNTPNPADFTPSQISGYVSPGAAVFVIPPIDSMSQFYNIVYEGPMDVVIGWANKALISLR